MLNASQYLINHDLLSGFPTRVVRLENRVPPVALSLDRTARNRYLQARNNCSLAIKKAKDRLVRHIRGRLVLSAARAR